jgi:hypothetical protein
MFDIIFEYYRLNNYDTNAGGGITLTPNKVLGLTVGNSRPMYNYDVEPIEEDDDIEIDDASLEAISKKLYSPVYSIDRKRSDPSHTSGNMRQAGALNEKSDHTNTATKGMIPFRQRKFDGPPVGGGGSGQAFRTTGNLRKTGTLFGTSRAPIFLDDEDPVDFDYKSTDPMERAFLKQQRKMKKMKKRIKQLNK